MNRLLLAVTISLVCGVSFGQGLAYTVHDNLLYRFSYPNGTIEAIGPTGLDTHAYFLEFAPDGRLFAVHREDTTIFEIDLDTGIASVLSTELGTVVSHPINGMTIDSSGDLWVIAEERLYKTPLLGGGAEFVVQIDSGCSAPLSFIDDRLLMDCWDGLFEIDLVSGHAHFIGVEDHHSTLGLSSDQNGNLFGISALAVIPTGCYSDFFQMSLPDGVHIDLLDLQLDETYCATGLAVSQSAETPIPTADTNFAVLFAILIGCAGGFLLSVRQP